MLDTLHYRRFLDGTYPLKTAEARAVFNEISESHRDFEHWLDVYVAADAANLLAFPEWSRILKKLAHDPIGDLYEGHLSDAQRRAIQERWPLVARGTQIYVQPDGFVVRNGLLPLITFRSEAAVGVFQNLWRAHESS